MQNKGFVKVFAVLLTLVCCFYLSFTFVTRHYENAAKEYANGDLKAESQYLDSISTEQVWLGYTLKECREKEIGLGLDLKGGMNVILEIDAAAVLRTLGNEDDPQFIKALDLASEENRKGSNKDYITLFIEQYEKIEKSSKLAGVFSSKMRDQIKPTDDNQTVKGILVKELQSVADNSFNVLRTRIDRFGVVAPNVQKLDRAERILIELPGIKEPERVKKLLQGSANLEFWKTYNQSEVAPYINAIDSKTMEVLAAASKTATPTATVNDSTATDSTATQNIAQEVEPHHTFTKNLSAYFAQAATLYSTPEEQQEFMGNTYGVVIAGVHIKDTAAVNSILSKYKDLYPSDLKFGWGFKPITIKNRETNYFQLYTLRGDGTKKGPALAGDVITNAREEQGQKGSAWSVSMEMNSAGAKRWATITGSEAEKKGNIAIVLDGYVYSAPTVQNKIEGGNSQITGNFSVDEAKDLVNVLKSGKMKAGVRIVQEDIVGPSLGQEAIDAGIISFVVALIVLMVYMCLVYGFIPGMIANGALLVNLFFTLGTLAAFNAVLTLPGIAGLVLALAMAVDANVLIYERTKEELKSGKNIRTAVADGYKHAFSAIFDSNLTSIITGLILYFFGTGAIRGFAITEIIGISASFFTAIFMTRMVYNYAFSKGKFTNLTFSSKPLQNFLMDTKINFLNMHKKAYMISGIVIVLGLVSVFTLGLNNGIDFSGGRNYVIRFDNAVNTQDISDALKPVLGTDNSTVSVITIGSSNQVRVSTNYKIEDSSDAVEAEIRDLMNGALTQYMKQGTNIDDYIQSSQKVGPSVADDMKTAAIGAVLLAILCMGLYILLRFRDIAFSVGTIIAVAHDAAIIIFAYSFCHVFMPFSLEIDQTFIAAILTVVGFSIHDKVVIFDRVRERRRDFPNNPIGININESLNSTLTRTVSTSLSTLLVLICIFVLGGESIRSFTFAMILGIILGTYSSVFIATPIAYDILKREKKNKA